jgi:putative FmdB family regulatory protein
MPTYDYDCPQCGSFDALRSVSMRNQAAACPSCGGLSARILSVAPSLALMEDGARRAMATRLSPANAPG